MILSRWVERGPVKATAVTQTWLQVSCCAGVPHTPTYSPLDKSPASPCHDGGIVTRTQACWLHHSRMPGPEEPSLPSDLEHQPRAAGCREVSCSRNALSTQLLRTQCSPAPRNQQDPRSTRLSYVLHLSPIHFTQFCEVAQKMHLF